MGGQACVFYGAAEFSRDIDFAILVSPANFERLKQVLEDLQAGVIAVPPFDARYLRKGHAVHFRCFQPEVSGLRIDVMTKMRGVDDFKKLWDRRTTLSLEDGTVCELISLPDLVQAKKTQRDKDWPMLRRLVENDYFSHRRRPTQSQLRFWFIEMRTPELLRELADAYPVLRKKLLRVRPLLSFAEPGKEASLSKALLREENAERQADREYWAPLRRELEKLRHTSAKG
jgi:hypothetical protein